MTGRSAEASSSMTARISSSVGRGVAGAPCVGADVVRHRLVEQVLGQRQDDRTGPSAERLAACLGHRLGHLVGRAGLRGPLGKAAERGDLVDLLERLETLDVPADLADEHEHRRRILASRVDPDAEVRATRRTRRQARGGPSGELSVRLCHERRRTLVAGRDDADPGALECVEEPEERLARDGEGVADAGCAQLVGDVAADGARPGVDDGLGHLRGGLGRRLGRGSATVAGSASGSVDSWFRRRLGRRLTFGAVVSVGRGRAPSVPRRRARASASVASVRLRGRLQRWLRRRDRCLAGQLVGRGCGVELGHGDCAPSVDGGPRWGWSAVVLELERDRQVELAQATR